MFTPPLYSVDPVPGGEPRDGNACLQACLNSIRPFQMGTDPSEYERMTNACLESCGFQRLAPEAGRPADDAYCLGTFGILRCTAGGTASDLRALAGNVVPTRNDVLLLVAAIVGVVLLVHKL